MGFLTNIGRFIGRTIIKPVGRAIGDAAGAVSERVIKPGLRGAAAIATVFYIKVLSLNAGFIVILHEFPLLVDYYVVFTNN